MFHVEQILKGDKKMKENTKFLWMYVGILFSFALILILFAGLSQSTSSEQTKGLKADITELSEVNTQLKGEIAVLSSQLQTLTSENDVLKQENQKLKNEKVNHDTASQALLNAVDAYKKGKKTQGDEIMKTIDPQSLTEAQLYIYNELVS